MKPLPVRKAVTALTAQERKRFVNAIHALKDDDGALGPNYDAFVAIHDTAMAAAQAHQSPAFFPWHRKFLIEFEAGLQRVSPTTADDENPIGIPYWDWTAVGSNPDDVVWRDDFMGPTGDPVSRIVLRGPFSGAQWSTWPSGNAPLKRSFGELSLSLPDADALATAMRCTVYDVPPWNAMSRKDEEGRAGLRNMVEGFYPLNSIHNQVHEWVGGDFVGPMSPNDPVFWIHHSFIDKVWVDWQAAHPQSDAYQPMYETPGATSVDQILAPFGITVKSVLDHTKFYAYE